MQNRKTSTQPTHRRNAAAIKTTFMELLGELTRLTDDDALVVATMQSIFAAYQVRSVRSLVPVRLVHQDLATETVRCKMSKSSSAWA
jgi:hypothetical protein